MRKEYVEHVQPEGEPVGIGVDYFVDTVQGQGQQVPDQHQEIFGLVLLV
jgi:hypothetical protein